LCKKISQEKLIRILAQHRLWLESDGVKGTQANFTNASLQGLNGQGADLRHARLYDAVLVGANLMGVDLMNTDISFVDLRDVNIQNANLLGAYFECADLRGAKLDAGIVDVGSIWGARFTPDALPWLMLRPKWVKEQNEVHIHEEKGIITPCERNHYS
jgi:hypothetical protein